jgi:hypothetical protein
LRRTQLVSCLLAGALALPMMAVAQPGRGPGAGRGAGAGPGPGQGMGMGGGMGMQNWSRERMYGTPLMTLEERQAHQRQMWNAKTVEERNKLREEHRKQMLERAQKQNFKVDEKQDDMYSVPALPK